MASETPLHNSSIEPEIGPGLEPVETWLEGLLVHHGLNKPRERAVFEASLRQMWRHAPLFGYADHPDVDPELLEQVLDQVHQQLAQYACAGATRAVEAHVVRSFVTALRSCRGLRASPEPSSLCELGMTRLCAALGCDDVPLVELLAYHPSLERHYVVHPDCFTELIEWTIAWFRDPRSDPDEVARFAAAMRAPRPSVTTIRRERVIEGAVSVGAFELPPQAWRDPLALAEFAGREHAHEPNYSQLWAQALLSDLHRSEREETSPRQLSPLIEHALLVYILALEDPQRPPSLSSAADHLMVFGLLPRARAIGSRTNRHEPVAAALVSVVAHALRPWSFAAPSLSTHERVVLLAMLSELATSKARKLLHQEKKHASAHADPELIRAAVNRSLARLPGRVQALSPKARIDRIAASFRYLNRRRRGRQPRARDLAIVAELIGEAHC